MIKLECMFPLGKRSRRLIFGAGAILFFLALGAGVLTLSARAMLRPVAPQAPAAKVDLTVPPGASTTVIGKMLADHGLVREAYAFTVYCRIKGVDGQLKAGTYAFSPAQSLPDIVAQLLQGPPARRVFTVAEGFTLDQIAALLDRLGYVDKAGFYQAVATGNYPYPFLAGLPPGPHRLEGYLFPDTYKIGDDTSPETVVDLMLRRFAAEMDRLDYPTQARQAGLSVHQAVTIASMVEREAKVAGERPLIAGVILNRLRRGMPLQIDATVQYALGKPRARLSYKDLAVNSPYNTYRINGLPPGPIASPGEASLLAAVHPARTPYLYYVARPDGTHAFATTLAEHNRNKRRYIH